MALRVLTDIPYGRARAIAICVEGDTAEVEFAVEPRGGEALWFALRLADPAAEGPRPARVRLTLKHADFLSGPAAVADCLPVYRAAEQGWHRLPGGLAALAPDGRLRVTWTLPYPETVLDVAFCFPYGRPEVQSVLDKSKGYWKADEIGLTQGGRPLVRLANDYGAPGGGRHGVYVVARQGAAETPASWVLDGALQLLSRLRKDAVTVWAVPLANADGAEPGRQGREAYPADLAQAWGAPPLRHECGVLQHDIARWQGRCRPDLVLDLRAAGPVETDGVYALLPDAEATPEPHKAAEKWANVIQQELGAEYAAKDFKRPASAASAATCAAYAAGARGLPALTLAVPWSRAGATVLSQKHYREAGERLAKALLRRAGG